MTKICETLEEFVYFGTKIELTVEGKKFTWDFRKGPRVEVKEPVPEPEVIKPETVDYDTAPDAPADDTVPDAPEKPAKPATKGTGRGKSQK